MKDEILKEEVLSDEQLEQVAGGTARESVKDSQFFHALGLIKQSYSYEDFRNYDKKALGDVTAAFNSLGISYETNEFGNWYLQILGKNKFKKLTRDEALKMVCDKVSPGFDYSKYL